jgi:putative DNA primase/helicase
LLSELVDALRRYVVLTKVQTVAVALWILFSHAHDAFDVSPRLVGKSAQKRSGKTTLFRLLARVVAKPRFLSGITSSALLRVIELHQPTLLIDEMDALMAGDMEMAQALRGMMNAGFDRASANLTMNVPTRDNGYEPREFSCWAPMALAGIGSLPDTVRDRAIEIEMKRKLPSETVRKLRRRDGTDLNDIVCKLARWARDNLDALQMAEPAMPDGLNDRAADAWEPLVAIADLVGDTWPSQARAAALSLSGDDMAAAKDENSDTMLLSDIRDAFKSLAIDRLSSESLTNHLTALEGRPWAEWSHGKPISKYQLSKRLKKYDVVSGTTRLPNGDRLSGYRLEDFEDAFSRYLPRSPVSTHDNLTSSEKQGEIASCQLVTEPGRHEFETARNPSNSAGCQDVTSSTRPPSAKRDARAKMLAGSARKEKETAAWSTEL